MTVGIKHGVSCSDYYYNNNTNTLLIGFDSKLQKDKFSFGVFNGVALDNKKGGSLVLDLKASYNYDKNGFWGQNLRVRNNLGEGAVSTQFRYSPCTVNIPLSNNTSVYLNPHAVAKYNFTDNKWDTSFGAFLGVTQKFKNGLSVSVEAQRYNIQTPKVANGNWGANLIISKSF